MDDISTDIQVWFLRHGKTPFNYENSTYDDFIDKLCNGYRTPLAKDLGIDLKSLPKRVDFVGYSPTLRTFATAEMLRKKLDVRMMKEMKSLIEVKFDWDIISHEEYTSLAENRKDILERWYDGRNKAETFEDSLGRVKGIEAFLSERREKTVILVTHGWFLRLLEIYFVQGKYTPTIDDLLIVEPVPLGHSIKAIVRRKNIVKSKMEEIVRKVF